MLKEVDALTGKLDVKYCIPDWLRSEQVKISCARFPDRIQLADTFIDEPLALVCFGTSLQTTWQQLKDFKYIMSCSGSHKFLREKDITPDWHSEDFKKLRQAHIDNQIEGTKCERCALFG